MASTATKEPRSRYVDYEPTGKNIVLTQNDIDILLLLQDIPYLPSTYLGELLGYTATVTETKTGTAIRYEGLRKRLRDLRKELGLLQVPLKSWPKKGDTDKPAVYQLALKGKAELKARGLSKPSMRLTNDFAHDMDTCLVAAQLRLFMQKYPKLRLLDANDILAFKNCPVATRRSTDPFKIPVVYWYRETRIKDAFKRHDWPPFAIAAGGNSLKFSGIELDRDSEGLFSASDDRASIERHISKILALLDTGYKLHFGDPRFWVLIFTINQQRADAIKQLIYDLTKGKGSKHILIGTVQDWEDPRPLPAPSPDLFERDLMRAYPMPFNLLHALGLKGKRAD